MLLTAFDAAAGIASILGLIASIGAFFQAKRATTAAREARDGIVLRTLADEFELACVRIDQLTDFLLHDRLPEAAIRAQELTSALSEIPYRRSPYLDEERKNELLDAREQARIISQEITPGRKNSPVGDQKRFLVDLCQKISMTPRKNLGTIKGEIDVGATQ